jgi:hypothetical protein
MTTANSTAALPRRGQFHYQMLLGDHSCAPELFALDGTSLGLPWSAVYFYGTLRDDRGESYTVLRVPEAGGGGRKRFFLQTTQDADDLRVHPASRHSVRNTGFVRSHADGVTVLASPSQAEGNPFRIEVSATTSRWVEAGVMDLRGTLIEPGLQWHLPHGNEGYHYVSQLYDVEGEILGRPVRGFYGADDMYMHGQVYDNDLLIGKRLHTTWYTWATRYVDGTLDAGHFMLGHDGLGMLLLCDETGAVNRTTDVDGRVDLDSSGTWPARIEVHAPDQSWEFLPDPKGRMVDFMPIPNPQAEGRWRRIGDTREPAHWFAYGEIAPSHGTVPRRGTTIL